MSEAVASALASLERSVWPFPRPVVAVQRLLDLLPQRRPNLARSDVLFVVTHSALGSEVVF